MAQVEPIFFQKKEMRKLLKEGGVYTFDKYFEL